MLRFPVIEDMIKVSPMSQNERLRSEESIGWRIETFDTDNNLWEKRGTKLLLVYHFPHTQALLSKRDFDINERNTVMLK